MSSIEKPPAVELWDEMLDGPSSRPNNRAVSMFFRVVIIGSAAVWLVAAIAIFSDVTLNEMAAFLLIGFGFMVALGWVTWSLCLRGGTTSLRSRREMAEWTFVPLAGLLGLVLMATDLDTSLRLKLSEPALRRCLAEPRPGGATIFPEDGGRRVGLFWFRSIHDRTGYVELRDDFSYPPGGLLYCPARPPQILGEHYYWHLGGPWWRYENHY